MFNIPILFLVFNRPELTYRVFETIKEVKPKKLFIAADGPRVDVEGEAQKCKEVRELILNGIDWDCEVKTLFQNRNLGCGSAVSAALAWFFENVEEGIIIEDDILPSSAFIEFTSLMLDKYKDDNSIFSINGNSLGLDLNDLNYGYTKYFNMWGWGTWRRSWKLVMDTWIDKNNYLDLDIKDNLTIFKYISNDSWFEYWNNNFIYTSLKKIDTWDYKWIYTCLKSNRRCIYPTKILVQNIGFGADATHTLNSGMEGRLGKNITQQSITKEKHDKIKQVVVKNYEFIYIYASWNMFTLNLVQSGKSKLFTILEYWRLKLAFLTSGIK